MEKKTKQKIKEIKAEIKKWEKEKKEAFKRDGYVIDIYQWQIDFCNNCLKELEDIYKKKENANE